MKVAIFGAGGCGVDLLAVLERAYDGIDGVEIFFVDDALLPDVCGRPVVKLEALPTECRIILAAADGAIRRKMADRCSAAGFEIRGLRAATVLLSKYVSIHDDATFSDYTIVGPRSTIGRHFQCNYHSYVAHDCHIGDFVTFAPGVRCNGSVVIGDYAYVGSGAIIKQGIKIGARATIGMGAIVTKDVPDGATVYGRAVERSAVTAKAP